MNDSNRRRHPRVKIPLLVQYRVSPLEEFRTDYATDVSQGGIFLSSELKLPAGTVLQVQFLTRDHMHLVAAEARVVRAVDGGAGVAFIKLDPADHAVLEESLARAMAAEDAKD